MREEGESGEEPETAAKEFRPCPKGSGHYQGFGAGDYPHERGTIGQRRGPPKGYWKSQQPRDLVGPVTAAAACFTAPTVLSTL